MSHIGSQLAHEMGIVLDGAEHFAERAIHRIRNNGNIGNYDSPQQPEQGVDMTVAADLHAFIDKAEQDAARLERYVNEPMAEEVTSLLELIPGARAMIVPFLAGVRAFGSAAPAPVAAPVVPDTPATAAAAVSSDPRTRSAS